MFVIESPVRRVRADHGTIRAGGLPYRCSSWQIEPAQERLVQFSDATDEIRPD
jgi:hypothetical protein